MKFLFIQNFEMVVFLLCYFLGINCEWSFLLNSKENLFVDKFINEESSLESLMISILKSGVCMGFICSTNCWLTKPFFFTLFGISCWVALASCTDGNVIKCLFSESPYVSTLSQMSSLILPTRHTSTLLRDNSPKQSAFDFLWHLVH